MKTLLLLILGLACATGCATRETSPPPQRESASLTLRAEQAISMSFDVVDAFLLWEYNNREQAGAGVRDVAERLRRDAPGAFMEARSALRRYKGDPSPQRASCVELQLQTLAEMARKAKGAQ